MIPWETLNAEQRQAVEAWDEALMVMAPVGTGKTNVLSLRAAHAIEKGVKPQSVLCLSFTNKAAREVKSRLVKHLGRTAGEVTAKTFHGLCAQILRAESDAVGWDRDFVIYDEEDCRTIFGEVLRREGIRASEPEQIQFEFMLIDAAARARLSRFEEPPGRQPQEVFDECLRESRVDSIKRRGGVRFKPLLSEYVYALRERHAVDFADLIVGVNRLWDENPEALERWRAKFGWIQVDEVQDTNRSEYRPLRMLAEEHKRLSFFGDIDQTIYEWRGSAPGEVLADYKARFAPVKVLHFTRNYRSTRRIIEACEKLIMACPGALTKEIVPQSAEEGEAVGSFEAANTRDEAQWIAGRARQLAGQGVPYSEMAVLVRTNFTARELSRHFEELKLPHTKVEEFKFFQRAEVKDALAHLRLLVNPHDNNALARYLRTPPKGVGDAAVESLLGEPREAGLKLGDLLSTATLDAGDPFLRLLEAARAGRVVVFDIESTGLKIGEDEIVELAAARGGAGGSGQTFHAYLKPSRPVGDSEDVHHLSDGFLARNGEDARAVLERFREFCAGCVLAGHNIPLFDVPMLASACRRLGLADWGDRPAFDTLDLTRRFHRMPRYNLGEICQRLGLKAVPAHRAGGDVAATVDLLQALLPKVEQGLQPRVEAVKKYGARFRPLAQQVERWRSKMTEERPAELLERVLDESGLLKHYGRNIEDAARKENLGELVGHFRGYDEASMQPLDALMHVLGIAALGREIDGQGAADNSLLLLTVHQAKGLEFDTVFVAGAADGEFPLGRSVRAGLETEEHRLFYVAVSRAKRRLYLSYPIVSKWGREQLRSRYIRTILGSSS
ncbi:MAG: UvrD-helicase domain-containing protein [Candidatus Solibacter usitatus]|nr:UvrD-helicase domain-containing protein [Candidatus Solibacter usitatus]